MVVEVVAWMEAEQEPVAGAFFYYFFQKMFAECFLGHSAKSSPSARQKTLGKTSFAVKPFVECRLPSVTLGKPFAECFWGFTVCP